MTLRKPVLVPTVFTRPPERPLGLAVRTPWRPAPVIARPLRAVTDDIDVVSHPETQS